MGADVARRALVAGRLATQVLPGTGTLDAIGVASARVAAGALDVLATRLGVQRRDRLPRLVGVMFATPWIVQAATRSGQRISQLRAIIVTGVGSDRVPSGGPQALPAVDRRVLGLVRDRCGLPGDRARPPGGEPLDGPVEVVETFIGGEEPDPRGGRAKGKKALVAIAFERI